jgi:hypothetical protein
MALSWYLYTHVLIIFIILGATTRSESASDHDCPDSCNCHVYGYVQALNWNNTRLLGFPPHDMYFTDCRAVNLTAIPPDLYVTDTHLELSRNYITIVYSGAFSRLSGVKYLDLSGKNIRTLEPGCFDGLASLESLVLMHNKLSVGDLSPGTFSGLSALTALHLFNNCDDRVPLKQYPDGVLAELGNLLYLTQYQDRSLAMDLVNFGHCST